MSNLKQISLAFMLYIQNYNGFLPAVEWCLPAGTSNDDKGYIVLVRKNYIKAPSNWDKKTRRVYRAVSRLEF